MQLLLYNSGVRPLRLYSKKSRVIVTMIAVIAFLVFCILILTSWTYFNTSKVICKYNGHLVGKVVIITGANSGMGFETAKDLAQRGAIVIAACRNAEKGKNAVNQIIKLSCNNEVHFLQLDLASFSSINTFVGKVMQLVSRVDVLINNAGEYTTKNEITEDGFLFGIQVNYLGPFLLTHLLLPTLKASAPSRIVNVSSILYQQGKINFDNFQSIEKFHNHEVYCNTKLFTILMTIELSRRIQGTGVTVNCLHPGIVNTNMMQQVNIYFVKIILKALKSFFKTPWEGAQTTIYLSVSPDVEKISGCYFKDCRIANLTSTARNLVTAQKLWSVSEKFVKLK